MPSPPAVGVHERPASPGLEELVRQLLEWGLVGEEDIVGGDLRLSSSARRNLNLRVERRRAPSYLIKQPAPGSTGTVETLRNEARFYRFCADEPAAAPMTRWMPPFVATFESDRILVLELVRDGRHPWQVYREHYQTGLPQAVPMALGRALGELHALFGACGLGRHPRLGELRQQPPGYFDFHRPRPEMLREASPARLRLCHSLQQEADVVPAIEAARAGWRVETVIHGDVRSENLLVVPPAEADGPRLLLLDWEFVQHGDPAWDLAGALEDHVRFWLEGMSPRPDLDPAERLATATWPLAVVQEAVRALWEAYLAASGRQGADAWALLHRATAYSGARLIQTAWEHCRNLERPSSLAVLLLQVAANVLADPERASRDLYGLVA